MVTLIDIEIQQETCWIFTLWEFSVVIFLFQLSFEKLSSSCYN
ncbi:hypothetical protein SA27298_1030 [Streptococcus anginosus]|nr:hypothetical protein SA27298_1030 [Streptococcus anginosus]